MDLKQISPRHAKHRVGAGTLAAFCLTFACGTWVTQAADLALSSDVTPVDATAADGIRISANDIALSNGVIRLSGNVFIQAVGTQRKNMKFTATHMTANGHTTVAEGKVQFVLGNNTFTTDRAMIDKEADRVTITMEVAEMSQLPH
jgi:lipopolysaccharide assembly outer membrane protein LptD (OstA)